MKNQTTSILAMSVLILTFAASASAAFTCPPMPDAVTTVNRDIKSDIFASIGSLGKVKAGEIGVKTETEAKNLFEKYPDVGWVLALQMMSATYCNMLKNSTSLHETEKIDRWEKFQNKVLVLEGTPPPPPPLPKDCFSAKIIGLPERTTAANTTTPVVWTPAHCKMVVQIYQAGALVNEFEKVPQLSGVVTLGEAVTATDGTIHGGMIELKIWVPGNHQPADAVWVKVLDNSPPQASTPLAKFKIETPSDGKVLPFKPNGYTFKGRYLPCPVNGIDVYPIVHAPDKNYWPNPTVNLMPDGTWNATVYMGTSNNINGEVFEIYFVSALSSSKASQTIRAVQQTKGTSSLGQSLAQGTALLAKTTVKLGK